MIYKAKEINGEWLLQVSFDSRTWYAVNTFQSKLSAEVHAYNLLRL